MALIAVPLATYAQSGAATGAAAITTSKDALVHMNDSAPEPISTAGTA